MISNKSYTFEEARNATKNFRSKEVSASESVVKFLYNSAKLVAGNEVIVEIGAFIGYARVFCAFGSSAGNGVTVHSIDPWGLSPSSTASRETYQDKLRIIRKTFDEFLQNIKEAGLETLCVPHRAYAHTYSQIFPKNLKIGLLFIDGNHSEWEAFTDYLLYQEYLADGATVVFHDYGAGSVERAVGRIDKSKIRDGLIFEIWGTCTPIREWAYIDNVVNIIKEGIYTKEDFIYPVNLAQKKGYTIKESAEMIADSGGFKGKLTFNTDYQEGYPIKILDDKKFRQISRIFYFSIIKRVLRKP